VEKEKGSNQSESAGPVECYIAIKMASIKQKQSTGVESSELKSLIEYESGAIQ
jgi:hypothetical protein